MVSWFLVMERWKGGRGGKKSEQQKREEEGGWREGWQQMKLAMLDTGEERTEEGTKERGGSGEPAVLLGHKERAGRVGTSEHKMMGSMVTVENR